MSKKHDESKDLRLISRIARVNLSDKTIRASKSAIIGNKSWGRIDFLTHYCGWHFVWDNSAGVGGYKPKVEQNENFTSNTNARKAEKEHKLTDKRNKRK